jgi:hypothetical protein
MDADLPKLRRVQRLRSRHCGLVESSAFHPPTAGAHYAEDEAEIQKLNQKNSNEFKDEEEF